MSMATLESPAHVRPAVYAETIACSGARGAVSRRSADAREHRLERCRRVICVRRSLADDTYENDLKLSIALDRLMDELELA